MTGRLLPSLSPRSTPSAREAHPYFTPSLDHQGDTGDSGSTEVITADIYLNCFPCFIRTVSCKPSTDLGAGGIGSLIIPILQMRKLRHREIEQLG